MRFRILTAMILGLIAAATSVQACGLKGAAIPVGTPIQGLTMPNRARPTMGFGEMQASVTRAAIVAPPCHGTLTVTHPLGFRYAPAPGFVGRDMYAVEGCVSNGRCAVTAAVVTVTP